jgi:hypothetical protein
MKEEQLLNDWANEAITMQTLNCKKSTLYYLRKNEKLTYSKIGRKVFYSISSINKLLNENRKDAI